MQCPSCGRENRSDALFCNGCGSSLGLDCAKCGRSNARDARFCDGCGSHLAEASEPTPNQTADAAHVFPRPDHPTSFASGRYQVKEFLGGGAESGCTRPTTLS